MRKLIIALALLLVGAGAARAGDPKFEHRSDDGKPPPKPTVWKANMTLGLVWVDGNAESFGFSASALAAVKHYNNAVELLGQGAYAKAGTSSVKGGPVDGDKTAAENWLWRLRYDRFLTLKDSLYAAFVMSGDRPA